MTDDVEAALSAMEDDAPLTVEGDDENEGLELEFADESEGEEKPKPQRAKLPPEEIEKRWQDTKRALKEERRRNQEIQDRYEERFQAAIARLTPKQEAQLENKLDLDGIDPDADPIAALKALAGVVKGYQGEVKKQTEQQQQEQQRTQAEQNLISAIDTDARDFAEDFPDYYDGQAHYVNARFAMLESAGYSRDEAVQAVKFELMQIGAKALQGRKSPAEAIYKAARAIGYGYKPQAPKGAERIEQANAGQKTGSKQNGGGQSGSGGGMSFKQIASLNGAAFDKAMNKLLSG